MACIATPAGAAHGEAVIKAAEGGAVELRDYHCNKRWRGSPRLLAQRTMGGVASPHLLAQQMMTP